MKKQQKKKKQTNKNTPKESSNIAISKLFLGPGFFFFFFDVSIYIYENDTKGNRNVEPYLIQAVLTFINKYMK